MYWSAVLPDGSKETFKSNVPYTFGTSYLDIFGRWHLGSKHKTLESAKKSAARQNTYETWKDKPVQVVEIRSWL